MEQATAIAISGGMDSLVAARLLQQSGHRVFGIHFISGYENVQTEGLGRALGIEIFAVDCRRPFADQVVSYFVNAYKH
ncbi:MAG TPA: tRNA 2-thiouridine(34) synthase MnmA, partial [Desulfosalsimonadaceae bacterium]|nr:tRNA 2-thiouridine(34) synthase MnmA [Desulfosalsimonadaceae bacterium]